MSIAVDHRNEGRINRPGLVVFGGACCVSSGYDHPTHASTTQRRRDGLESDSFASSPSSSIGINSDASPATSLAGGDAEDEVEVQSSYKGPFDTMDTLHEALPLKRGISVFYSGKSKSFTSLGDALSVLSARDLAKPRKNFGVLGSSSSYNSWLRSSGGGISKRTAGLGRRRVII